MRAKGMYESGISIHPPLAGWDAEAARVCGIFLISIHPPLAGWDGLNTAITNGVYQFQSTHPSQGGTKREFFWILYHEFQSTHPSQGGTSDNTIEVI